MNKVVVRFRDGRVLKGVSLDLDPGKPSFHVRPPEGGQVLEVRLDDLKAVFFVRSFEGDAGHKENRVVDPKDPRSRGAAVASFAFEDGEQVVGMTIRYPPNKPFFYVVPADAGSNNIRILVNQSAVKAMNPLS